MVEISLSGSGEGPGWATAPGYSTARFLPCPRTCDYVKKRVVPLRGLYVLDPTDAARAARRQRVSIEEREDGSLSFWHSEHELQATAFPKDHSVRQGGVVENKRLSATMDFIKEKQRQRTEVKIAKPSTTLRDARLLRAGTPRRTATGSSAEARS